MRLIPLVLESYFQQNKTAERQDGNEQSPRQRAPPPRGEQGPLRAQPPLQDHRRGDVRHIRQVRRHQADQGGQHPGDEGHGLRRVRGHLRRQERLRPSVGL